MPENNQKQMPFPSVNALRSFETTARLGSVTKAAEELHVTPSAVSHQIRKLEESFQKPLIDFSSGKATLTSWGSVLYPGLTDGFMRVREAVNLLGEQSQIMRLTIAARPLFASKWLSPRLDRFWEQHPNIALRMRYLTELYDSTSYSADASIEWSTEPPPNTLCVPLFPAALSPVCSPALGVDTRAENLPESLGDMVLLTESNHQNDCWKDWLRQLGAVDFRPERTIFLDDGNIRLKAAIDGKGIDMGVPIFLKEEFENKSLIEPFPKTRLEGHYYLIFSDQLNDSVKAFRDWILEETNSGAPAT